MPMEITQAISLVLLLAALYTDLLWKKIPNTLTLTAMLLGICLNAFAAGGDRSMGFAVQGLVVGMGIWIIPFILGGTGGGDVKLFGALGALSGPGDILWISIYAAIAGGIISLVLLVKQSRITAVKEIIYDINLVFLSRGQKNEAKRTGHIPYSVPTALGYAFFTVQGGLF